MNKKQLSLAILVAMGLTACGSSSNNKTDDPSKGGKGGNVVTPNPNPVNNGTVAETDPSGFVIDEELATRGFDKFSSMHAKFYIKNAASRFDSNNSEGNSTATTVDKFTLEEATSSNTDLSNYLLARESQGDINDGNNASATVRFAGLNPNGTGSIAGVRGDMHNLQARNGAVDVAELVAPGSTTSLPNVGIETNAITITQENPNDTAGFVSTLATGTMYNDGQNLNNDAATGDVTNNGLLFGYQGSGRVVRGVTFGSDDQQNNTSRYFGAKFADTTNSVANNSYTGVDVSNTVTGSFAEVVAAPATPAVAAIPAVPAVPAGGFDSTGAAQAAGDCDSTGGNCLPGSGQGFDNTGAPQGGFDNTGTPQPYVAAVAAVPAVPAAPAVTAVPAYTTTETVVTPSTLKLDNVQYGRITNNIDPLAVSGGTFALAAAQEKANASSVSNYFYRGLNPTSPEQMAALPQDAVFNYSGHAITYGLDHNAQVGDTTSVGNDRPTSVILNGSNTTVLGVFGSFVNASYNVGDKKVNGEVYDTVIVKDLVDIDNDTTNGYEGSVYRGQAKNVLINFTAGVEGNTFIGEATASHTDRTGKVKGSFYGNNANEMGGVINSIKDGYGYGAWGAAFGAQAAAGGASVSPVTGGNSDFVSDSK